MKKYMSAAAKQLDSSPFMNLFQEDPDSIAEPENKSKETALELEIIEEHQQNCCEYSISQEKYEECIKKLDDYFSKCADSYLKIIQ